ncbi:MAG: glutamate-5-semialdehyde dehydrogenase [Candidatus Falkowbacteria bacterium]
MLTKKKNDTLGVLARLLRENKKNIMSANRRDILSCRSADASMLDRLKTDETKISGMIKALNLVKKMPDPENRTIYFHKHRNGLKIENRTVPFGTILIIYESRPDVTIEAAAAAFKAGNRVILRGGTESRKTNLILVKLWREALAANGISKDHVTYLDLDRKKTKEFIKNSQEPDLIIPRGGQKLIDFVKKNTDIPVIASGRGNNFLYLDKKSDPAMAAKIIINGKSRISVCNALDKVLINRDLPDLKNILSKLVNSLSSAGIAVYGDRPVCRLDKSIKNIRDNSVFAEEFLSAKILLSLVKDIDAAIDLINKYSGGHSAAIITADAKKALKFQNEVDCAAVYHNASTRFTDGGEFGSGAEIAISTQKLHFRGPIGPNELVTNKWFISGRGQIRK